jgi:ABC-type glycerol-3-phosphate transport system permease component
VVRAVLEKSVAPRDQFIVEPTQPQLFDMVGFCAYLCVFLPAHRLMAASVTFALPCIVIFFLAQRYFVRGIVLSGVKG